MATSILLASGDIYQVNKAGNGYFQENGALSITWQLYWRNAALSISFYLIASELFWVVLWANGQGYKMYIPMFMFCFVYGLPGYAKYNK